jgi:hypothetical protein
MESKRVFMKELPDKECHLQLGVKFIVASGKNRGEIYLFVAEEPDWMHAHCTAALQTALRKEVRVLGGGYIAVDTDHQICHLWGRSTGYNVSFDFNQAMMLLKEEVPALREFAFRHESPPQAVYS